MADNKETTFILTNPDTGAANSPKDMVEGDSPATRIGTIGFAYKDSSGNVVLPQLNADGEVPVTFDSVVVQKFFNRGEISGGSATEATVASVALTPGDVYAEFDWLVSCRRDSYFKLVWHDNGVDNVLADVMTDAGLTTVPVVLERLQITAGGTGTQEIRIRANNLGSGLGLSALRGTVAFVKA